MVTSRAGRPIGQAFLVTPDSEKFRAKITPNLLAAALIPSHYLIVPRGVPPVDFV